VLVLVILVRNSYDVNDKFSWLKMKAEENKKARSKIRARSTAALHTNDVIYIIYVYKCEKNNTIRSFSAFLRARLVLLLLLLLVFVFIFNRFYAKPYK